MREKWVYVQYKDKAKSGTERNRTSDTAFRKRLLYPLSYNPSTVILPQTSRSSISHYGDSYPLHAPQHPCLNLLNNKS